MRLSTETTPDLKPAAEFRIDGTGSRLGLWGPLYFSLWLNALMLAVVALWPRQPELFLLKITGWGVGLGLVAALACQSRIALHDLMVGLSERDRFLLGLLMLSPLIMPALVRGPRIVPDGILWATPTMMLLAVTPALTRRLLALTLLGAWLAALRMTDLAGLGLLLGFGLSWLIALGATHFAHTGDPHGLGGWWPVRKVLFNSIAAAIPATVAAMLLWWAWPEPTGVSTPAAPTPQAPHAHPIRLIDRLDIMDWQALFWHGAVMVLLTLFVILLMHYVRRFFLRRASGIMAMKLIPGQVAQVEMRSEPPPPRKMKLGGTRGRIVQLWGRWAETLGQRAGAARQPGETAAAYALRLARENPEAAPPPEMTQLLERVHYGKDEPRAEDFEAMKHFVQEQAAKTKRSPKKTGQA